MTDREAVLINMRIMNEKNGDTVPSLRPAEGEKCTVERNWIRAPRDINLAG